MHRQAKLAKAWCLFFTEAGEDRVDTGPGRRIVRVGTHALKINAKTSLWTRLSKHRGQIRSGGGNHRGSIFRLLVGTALIAKHQYLVPTWDDRRASALTDVRAAELALEREVSKIIGAMQFIWVAVDDEPGSEVLAVTSNAMQSPYSVIFGRKRLIHRRLHG
jgi:hypothetical protein